MPLFALIFDSWLKLWMFVIKPEMLDWLDEIETEVLTWDGMSGRLHKYGGMQLDFHGHEIGHIHSNGIMDVLFTKRFKQELIKEGRIQDHHMFSSTGWISFHIDSEKDKEYAKHLLALSYQKNISTFITP